MRLRFLLTLFISLGLSFSVCASNLKDFQSSWAQWSQRNPKAVSSYLKSMNLSDKASIDHIYTKAVKARSLIIRRKNLKDLDILRFSPLLEFLSVPGNQLTELSFLKHTPNLKELEFGSVLQGNLISDISEIASLKQLTYLNLNHNQVSDIRPLTGLPLQKLSIRRNQISDISALANCKQLEEIRAQSNSIKELPTGKFAQLKFLELNHNHIASIQTDGEYPELRELWLRRNRLVSILPWPKLPKLNNLLIRNNPLKPLSIEFLKSRGEELRHDWPFPHEVVIAQHQ